ncbi:MAG: hypothetical protein JRI23_11390 [Deltaproteobacteria bacterium]|jgi:hypothetical protein|nr:hypothetical protein [Deltaproteobacteria bacterium]MBW2532301.1 hypothetical protein [Deltaproteobacteria bacterium]
MDAEIYGGVTVLHAVLFVVGLIVLNWVVGRVRRGMASSSKDDKLQPVECSACVWQGRVSRLAGRCPKCNEPLGDRAAKPRS